MEHKSMFDRELWRRFNRWQLKLTAEEAKAFWDDVCWLRDATGAAVPEGVAIDRTLRAQEHAIACGNLTLELQSALGTLLNACEEAGWPKTAEQMAPMDMARAALKKHLEPQSSGEVKNG